MIVAFLIKFQAHLLTLNLFPEPIPGSAPSRLFRPVAILKLWGIDS